MSAFIQLLSLLHELLLRFKKEQHEQRIDDIEDNPSDAWNARFKRVRKQSKSVPSDDTKAATER